MKFWTKSLIETLQRDDVEFVHIPKSVFVHLRNSEEPIEFMAVSDEEMEVVQKYIEAHQP